MILSDEVRIDKNLFMRLATASKNTIAEVAEHIENGTTVDRDLLDEVLAGEYDEQPAEPAPKAGDSAAESGTFSDRLTEDDFRRPGIPVCKDERDVHKL